MSSEEQDTNPYASPQTSTEPKVSAGPQRFRWRLIPAGLLLGFGGMMLLPLIATVIAIPVLLIWKGTIEPLKQPVGLHALMMVGGGLVGSIWVYSALAWWRRRWWRAVLTTIVGYALGGGFFYWLGGPPS